MFELTELNYGLAISTAYLIGCLTTGYYVVLLLAGHDIRAFGSGSSGARNVSRLLGHRAALATVVGDAGKGIAAVCLARTIMTDETLALSSLAAVTAGHIWPFHLGFRGGKGVATSMGALLAWDPALFALFVGIFFLTLAHCRKATFSIAFSYATLPIAGGFMGKAATDALMLFFISAIIVFLHRASALAEFRASGI